MGKKKSGSAKVKPWCWYCDREFTDHKVLIMHQRARHFKCPYCQKRLNSASGLVVHCAQVHHSPLDTVPHALSGHDTPELEIFGMEGVPLDDLQRHLNGLPIVERKRTAQLNEIGLVSLLAAQKVSANSTLPGLNASSSKLIPGTLSPSNALSSQPTLLNQSPELTTSHTAASASSSASKSEPDKSSTQTDQIEEGQILNEGDQVMGRTSQVPGSLWQPNASSDVKNPTDDPGSILSSDLVDKYEKALPKSTSVNSSIVIGKIVKKSLFD